MQGENKKESNLSEASIISAAFPMASTLLSTVPLFAPETAGLMPWIESPLLLGSHVPMYWIDPSRALGYSIAGLALPAAGVGLMFAAGAVPVAGPVSSTLLNGYSHLMYYSAYDTYLRGGRDGSGYSLSELAAAPFTWDNVKSPLVWIPSMAAPAVLVAFYLAFEPDLGTPVYESGQSYIGTAQVNPLLGGLSAAGFGAMDMLATAVGEEAYYRGIIYEEMKRAIGKWPARIFDMLFFPAVHLPSDIGAGLKVETVLFDFGWRSAMTLVFDEAMDSGGLPLAVAVHFWSDFVLIMARWVFYGG